MNIHIKNGLAGIAMGVIAAAALFIPSMVSASDWQQETCIDGGNFVMQLAEYRDSGGSLPMLMTYFKGDQRIQAIVLSVYQEWETSPSDLFKKVYMYCMSESV